MKATLPSLTICAIAIGALCTPRPSLAQTGPALSLDQARAIVAPIGEALNAPKDKLPDLMKQATGPEFRACSGENECIGLDALIKRLTSVRDAVPDLRWTAKDIWASGDTVIARVELAGTPAREFLGVPPSGKSFRIMEIDVFFAKDNKIDHSYHVENWAAARRQLAGE